MSRIRQVDIDTSVGYNYLIRKYFINNKNTTTYRITIEDTKEVLDIVAPNNSITPEILEALANEYEELSTLSYTLSDTGAYISTVQINDYADYPIELRAEKNKLVIRNTNIVFDLMLNEDKATRVAIMQAYYREHLGLNLSMEELMAIYNFIINTYTPYVYPLILETNTTPIYYSNSFACSNFSSTGKSTYQCDLNPFEQYNNTVIENIGLINADSATNTLTFSNTIPDTLKVGDTIVIEGATTVLDTYTYTADGTYTIKTINNNTIVTQEGLTGSYTYNYPLSYIVTSDMLIESIDRDTSTVTVSNNIPDSVQVGDIVYINGTQQSVEGETVTCDGEYIISSINENTFTTQTTPPTNYTRSTGNYPIASKRIYTGKIESIQREETSGTLSPYFYITLNTIEHTIEIGSELVVTYNNTETYFEVQSITNNILYCQYMQGELTEYEVNYPKLCIPTPHTIILISVTSSTNEEILPIGEFMVDDFSQCKAYLGLLPNNTVPPDSVYAKLGTEVGSEEVAIEVIGEDTPYTLNYLGLYSQVYGENNDTY